ECASSPHYLETLAREVRAKIRIGRGDLEGALDDSTRSLKLGRQIKDPQSLLPCLLQCSRCYALLGRLDEAHAFAAEAIQLVDEHVGYSTWVAQWIPVVREVGLEEELREI